MSDFWRRNLRLLTSILASVLGAILLIYLGVRFIVFFMPFVVGWIIATIGSPIVKKLEKQFKIKQKWGSMFLTITVLAIIVLILYFGIGRLAVEVTEFWADLPEYYSNIEEEFGAAGGNISGFASHLPESLREGIADMFANLDETITDFISSSGSMTLAGNFAKRVPNLLISVIVAIMSAYFFMADKEGVTRAVNRFLPESLRNRADYISGEFRTAVGGYFRAQAKIMIVISVVLMIGLFIFKVRFAPLLAILIAALDFLPIFGTGTVLVPWAVFKILSGNFRMGIGLLVLYAITLILHQVLQPKMVGDSIGMSPLATLFFIFIGYRIGGFIGLIIAIPIGMIIINLYKIGAFDDFLANCKELYENLESWLTIRRNS